MAAQPAAASRHRAGAANGTHADVRSFKSLGRMMAPLEAGVFVRRKPLSRLVAVLRFETPAVARHREAEAEVDQGYEYIDFDAERLPGRVDDRGLGRRQEIEDADDQDQAGILEEGDERIDQRRYDVPDRLRQDDQAVLFPVRQAKRIGGVVLA